MTDDYNDEDTQLDTDTDAGKPLDGSVIAPTDDAPSGATKLDGDTVGEDTKHLLDGAKDREHENAGEQPEDGYGDTEEEDDEQPDDTQSESGDATDAEAESDPEPADEPRPLDAQVVERAKAVGISEQQIRDLGSSAMLMIETREQLAERDAARDNTQDNGDGGSTDVPEGIDPEDFQMLDPSLQTVLKAQQAKIDQLVAEKSTNAGDDAAVRQARNQLQFEAYCDKLADRFPDSFGDKAKEQQANLDRLADTGAALYESYRARGEVPPAMDDLLESALRSSFPDAVEHESKNKTRASAAERQRSFTNPPAKRKAAGAKTRAEASGDAVTRWFAKQGMTLRSDMAGGEQFGDELG